MGWSFRYVVPHDPKAAIDANLTWTADNGSRRVLKSSFVGSTYYAAVEHLRPTGDRTVWAAVVLTKRSRGEWGTKNMSEHMGPCEAKCPKSILAMLTPTDSSYANEWRAKCHAYHAKKAEKPAFTAGDVVEYGGRRYRLDCTAGPRRGWFADRVGDGRRYRMSFAILADSRRVMPEPDVTEITAELVEC